MSQLKPNNKVAAIVPAYNEQATLGPVIIAIKSVRQISEVIVIDDGSSDNTALVAKKFGARVISQKNAGKGEAMRAGVAATDAAIILFCDADLVGLTGRRLIELIEPVRTGRAVMSIGLRDRYNLIMDQLPKFAPGWAISGERALRREIFEVLPLDMTRGYEIESTINDYCRKKDLPVAYVKMTGVGQVIKEKKLGLVNGLRARFKMMGQVLGIRIALLSKKW